MVKKTTSIFVPLVPKMPKDDMPNESRPNFDDFAVGMVTVKKDEKCPGTLRFANDVSIKTEAMVEKDVLETLTAFCGMNDSTGYLVTVDFTRANLSFRKNKKESKTDHPLPRGFDCLLLEFPILACALKHRESRFVCQITPYASVVYLGRVSTILNTTQVIILVIAGCPIAFLMKEPLL